MGFKSTSGFRKLIVGLEKWDDILLEEKFRDLDINFRCGVGWGGVR